MTLSPELPADRVIIQALQNGAIVLQGRFLNSSNSIFLGQIQYQGLHLDVVYKPLRGETPLWDFPHGTLAKREVAAFLVSEALGWRLVPATVFREDAPIGPGSVQRFIDHDPNRHYFSFSPETIQRLKPAAIFDLLVNNADRKASHILLDENDRLFLIDHGICFHAVWKLRTVVWDFAGQSFPPELVDDLRSFAGQLTADTPLACALENLLLPAERDALLSRARHLVKNPVFPFPDPAYRPYPFPPL